MFRTLLVNIRIAIAFNLLFMINIADKVSVNSIKNMFYFIIEIAIFLIDTEDLPITIGKGKGIILLLLLFQNLQFF
jgi:hypothetical protein